MGEERKALKKAFDLRAYMMKSREREREMKRQMEPKMRPTYNRGSSLLK